MAVNWGMAQQPSAFETAFDRGFQLADYNRQRTEQEARRNALSSYVQKPNEAGLNALATYAPEFVMQERGRLQEAAHGQRVAELTQQGASGNTDAILELWGLDRQAAAALDTREREHTAQGLTYLSQAALAIDAMPEEQRAIAWDDAIQRGVQQGFDDLGEYQGQYSPQALQSVVARAGQMAPLLSGRRPDYMAVPEGGVLVDTRNPQAVQAFGSQGAPQQAPQGPAPVQMRITPREYTALVQRYGPEQVAQRINGGSAIVTVATPDEARTLPSGTRILLPDGSEGRVP